MHAFSLLPLCITNASLCLSCCCYCYCSVAKSCVTLCDSMDCSTPGSPVLLYLPEFAQTHVLWVGDAIQPSSPLLLPSPPAFSLSQHQGLFSVNQLFPSGGQSIGAPASASVLAMNTQGWSPLGLTGLIFLLSKGLSRVFSTTKVLIHPKSFHCALVNQIWVPSPPAWHWCLHQPPPCRSSSQSLLQSLHRLKCNPISNDHPCGPWDLRSGPCPSL